MRSFMNRTFTRREKVLLLALVVILLVGLYFYAVHYPITTRYSEIDLEMEDVFFKLDVAKTRQGIYNEMRQELDEIFAMPEDELTVMPEYDNFQTLLLYFNTIFDGRDPELSFDNVRTDGSIVSRTVRFSFSAENWEQARDIVAKLTGTGYRCLLDSLSCSVIESRDPGADTSQGYIQTAPLRVTGSITFYELAQ